MGIAYKDLKPGAYYKGTDSGGAKKLVYVEALTPAGVNIVEIKSWEIERKTSGASWSATGKRSKNVSDDSGYRREMTPTEVRNDGLPFAPPDSSNSSPPSAGNLTSPSTKSPAKSPTLGATPSKPPALRKNGQPKAPVENNSTSKVCLCCGGSNKNVVLFQFSTFWCPNCEP